MAQHNYLGHRGEEAASRYLVLHGYNIVERDWRLGHRDLDIVAQKNGWLIIVEVKTRSSETYGRPEDSVGREKMHDLLLAANAFLKYNELDMPVRFDVISVVGNGSRMAVRHIINAFTPLDVYPTGGKR